MNRIDVSSADGGPYNYRFLINPYIYDSQDSLDYSMLEPLHSSFIHQIKSFDNRYRILKWENLLLSDSKISSLVTYFRSIKGKIRYFHFQDLASLNNSWPSEATSVIDNNWKKARIVDLKIEYRPGGSLKYANIELMICPEKV